MTKQGMSSSSVRLDVPGATECSLINCLPRNMSSVTVQVPNSYYIAVQGPRHHSGDCKNIYIEGLPHTYPVLKPLGAAKRGRQISTVYDVPTGAEDNVHSFPQPF